MSNQTQKSQNGIADILKGIIFIGLFAVPFLTLYVENDFFFPFITGKNFLFRIIVEIVLAAWVVLALYDTRYRPKFSWILGTFGILIAVMLAANLQAEHVLTAIWSNFERMDGYVTLVHVFAYFVVLGTMLQTPKAWSYFLHTTVVVAGIVALKGLSQLSGSATRVDSTLGNAAYMAVYMLFHIFFLFYLFIQTKVTPYRVVYVLLAILFMYVLLQTGTRGTAIGLVTGSIAMVGYIALFGSRFKQARKYALGALVGIVLLSAGFMAARDTAFIQNNPSLSRVANIDLGNDLRIRSIIWGMSVEGIKEKPLLGWGQGNFNYVFNEQYDPRLFQQEQWFDRVHNIVFDWLIAGGIIGLVSYFSIFAALFYYLVIKPIRHPDTSMTVIERGVLVGLIVGYVTHNLVVFDNIVSYIFFGTIIALIHSKISTPIPKVMAFKMPSVLVTQIVLPAMIVVTGAVVYFVNIPSMQAAGDVIVAFQGTTLEARYDGFDVALNRDSFAKQEIVEQFAQQAMGIAQTTEGVDPATKEKFMTRAETELLKMVEEKPGDARLHVFLASYYRATGNIEKAKEQMATARSLSPGKQAIILQQGAIELSLGNNTGARDFFKEAYELDTTNDEAKEYYIASLFYTKEPAMAQTLITESTPEFTARLAASDFVLSAVNAAGEYATLATLYEARVTNNGSNAQDWASLAFVYYQLKQNDKAIETLTRAKTAVPSFSTAAECFSANIAKGVSPEVGCQ
ncbi:O-antigen ligase family protein [Patescibacteria group bacterium]|nr:O-antigen ligase family protein [Patescibacteria group bacterium]